MTTAITTQAHNPPLPFTKDAIINHLRHQATNGPAYVQLGATRALAQLKGLFEEAKQLARAAHDAVTQQAPTTSVTLDPVQQALADGVDLADFSMYDRPDEAEEDEEAANQEDDDVP